MRVAFLIFALCVLNVQAIEITATAAGRLEISSPQCSLTPQAFLSGWKHCIASGTEMAREDGSYPFTIKLGENGNIAGTARFTQMKKSEPIKVHYTFTPDRDVELNALFVGLALDVDEWAGKKWQADDARGTFPMQRDGVVVFSGAVKSLTLDEGLAFTFSEPTHVMLQDDRQWGPTFSVRIGAGEHERIFKAGEAVELRFTVSTSQPLELLHDAPLKLEASKDWIPFKAELDIEAGSALDFSAMGLHDAPAGKHGYTLAKGAHFEFEKKTGVSQRFYGVNFCFGANVPDLETAKRIGLRLARIGYNAARLHHYENHLTEGSADGTTINPVQLAKFDALMAAFIKNGIYITTDLYVSRTVPWRSVGIDRDGNIGMDEFKLLVAVHEGAWENLKKFTCQWMLHINPHTGRTYAEEPALAWLAITNEGNFSNFLDLMQNIPEWQQEWKKWLAEKRHEESEAYKDIDTTLPKSIYDRNRHNTAFLLFLNEMEIRFVERARAFLRDELKCRALITNRSSWTNFMIDQIARDEAFDFVDDHFYVDHPRFLEKPWQLPSACDNSNPIRSQNMGAQFVVFTRLLDKPFTITEYNFCAPSRFRGLGGIVTGALGALQNWSGLWRFAYSHDGRSIANTHAPAMTFFDTMDDPLSLAAERASICLFLRRDIEPLKHTFAVVLPRNEIAALSNDMPTLHFPWLWLAWYGRLGTIVANETEASWSTKYPEAFRLTSEDVRREVLTKPSVTQGDGVLKLDRNLGTFAVTTPRTCGGFAEQGKIDADALVFEVHETPATVWVSSLDDAPIRASSRLLLTHLTDIQNTGIHYAERSRKTLLAWGGLPHLVRNGKTAIKLSLDSPESYKVYALTTSGRREKLIPSHVENGHLIFTAAVDAVPETATLLYEISQGSDFSQ